MKCEIIDNKLVVFAGTPTEQWALEQFINSNEWQVRGVIVDGAAEEKAE